MDGLPEFCQKVKPIVGSALCNWGPQSNNFTHNFVTKSKFFVQTTIDNLRIPLENMRGHAAPNNFNNITMLKIGCVVDKLQ